MIIDFMSDSRYPDQLFAESFPFLFITSPLNASDIVLEVKENPLVNPDVVDLVVPLTLISSPG